MRHDIPKEEIKNPVWKFLCLGISSGFGLGYAPVAPGTFGSLLGIPLGLALIHVPGWAAMLIMAAFFAFCLPFVKAACRHWGEMDSGKVVIDEVIGQAIALLSLRYFIRVEETDPPIALIVIGFVVFRALDIMKPLPAKTFDRQATPFGVIADDVVCGLYTALILRGFIILWPSL